MPEDVLDLTGDDGNGGAFVELSPWEYLLAVLVGMLRNFVNGLRPRRPAYGLAPTAPGVNEHVTGAVGELGVAKYRRAYWTGAVGVLDDVDVDGLGVRSVRRGKRDDRPARLILHPGDPDDRRFVLVVHDGPRCHLVGWIAARDGKRDEWWPGPYPDRPAFYVPHVALRALGELERHP